MCRRVVLVKTDVSVERVASVMRMEIINKLITVIFNTIVHDLQLSEVTWLVQTLQAWTAAYMHKMYSLLNAIKFVQSVPTRIPLLCAYKSWRTARPKVDFRVFGR
jgi:hypothetical protein